MQVCCHLSVGNPQPHDTDRRRQRRDFELPNQPEVNVDVPLPRKADEELLAVREGVDKLRPI